MITALRRSETFHIGNDVIIEMMQHDDGRLVVGVVTDQDISIKNDEVDEFCSTNHFSAIDFDFFLFVNQPQTVLPYCIAAN